MAIVAQDVYVRFNGVSSRLLKGTKYPDDAKIVQENKDKFIFEIKEELLIEEPVSTLTIEVVEETIEDKEPKEEVKKTRKTRKRK